MKSTILVIISVVLITCNSTEKKKVVSMNQPSKSLSELKNLVKEGNTMAYDELSIAFLDEQYSDEFLIYAIIMANKYDYAQAYFDVFDCFIETFRLDIIKIDEQTASLAIAYLEKAAKKGHEQAQEMVKEYSINSEIKDNRKKIIEMFNN